MCLLAALSLSLDFIKKSEDAETNQYKVLLRIRAVPNSAVFCIVSKDMLHSSSPKYLRWFFDIVPCAPMTIGTVFALFFHSLPISIAKSL